MVIKKHDNHDQLSMDDFESEVETAENGNAVGPEQTDGVAGAEKVIHSKKRSEPTRVQWEALFDIAKRIRAIEPWSFMWDMDFITLLLPGTDQPLYCSVLGNAGLCYGINIYRGDSALSALMCMIENDNEFSTVYNEQDCLMLSFGDREELTAKDRALLKELDLRFRGRHEWIYFRTMDPGYVPWYIDSNHADVLIQALQNIYMAIICLMENKLSVDFEKGQTLVRFYSETDDMWCNAIGKLPVTSEDDRTLVITNDGLIADIKKLKRSKIKLEFDVTCFPVNVCENRGDRPSIPLFLLLADKTSGIIIDQKTVGNNERVESAVLDMLIRHFMSYGRPLSINIRDKRTGMYIEDLCNRIDVKLIMGKEMPAINETIRYLTKAMSR